MRTIQQLVQMAFYMALLGAIVLIPHLIAYAIVPNNATGGIHNSLPACATEDSPNCYWDATTHGNGLGQSFIDIDGIAYYFGA